MSVPCAHLLYFERFVICLMGQTSCFAEASSACRGGALRGIHPHMRAVRAVYSSPSSASSISKCVIRLFSEVVRYLVPSRGRTGLHLDTLRNSASVLELRYVSIHALLGSALATSMCTALHCTYHSSGWSAPKSGGPSTRPFFALLTFCEAPCCCRHTSHSQVT